MVFSNTLIGLLFISFASFAVTAGAQQFFQRGVICEPRTGPVWLGLWGGLGLCPCLVAEFAVIILPAVSPVEPSWDGTTARGPEVALPARLSMGWSFLSPGGVKPGLALSVR